MALGDRVTGRLSRKDGVEAKRRSLITLGALKRESTGDSCDQLPASAAELMQSVLTPTSDNIPMEMRLSPEPLGKDRVPTPERRTRSPLERANSLDLPSDQDSPGIGSPDKIITSTAFIDITSSPTKEPSQNNEYDSEITCNWSTENNNNITLDKLDNVIKPIEFGSNINECSPSSPIPNIYMTFGEVDKVNIEFSQTLTSASSNKQNEDKQLDDRSYTIEYSQSYDNLEEKSFCTDNAFTGVSSSLDNLDDMEDRSMSIEIIQSTGKLDDTLAICTFPTKSKFRETHSLELLEEAGDMRAQKNKRHSRNKSITLQGQPQFWRSADVIVKSSSFEKCTNIDAQLECYDEALRQLAKVNIPKTQSLQQTVEIFNKSSKHFISDITPISNEISSHIEDDRFPQLHDIEPISLDFPPEILENEPDSLDVEKETSFPPPPTYFMEIEENEIVHINTVEACLQTVDINLPLPISMLTPIKENHFESDSLSNIEAHDGDESELSIDENDNTPRKCSITPSHFNVEVIVNNKSGEASPGSSSTPVNESQIVNYIKSAHDSTNYYDDTDDVFLQDGHIPDQYQKYFVDVRALQIHPDKIDFTKVLFPADTPSPIEKSPDEVNNSPVDKEIPTNKFPSLNFDIGGICNIKTNSAFVRIEKGENSESDAVGRPLRRKRKLLLAMRDAEGSVANESGIQMTSEADDAEEEDSDEDPPFWQSTDKGGFFMRQNTVIPINPSLVKGSLIDGSTPGSSKTVQGVIPSPPGSSEAETASASDTPKRSPKVQKGMLHSSLREATAEKGWLEEKAASLLGTAERLQYELEDSKQAEAAREDTIVALQTQLARLESRYTLAQEEMCSLRHRAVTAEQELEHLREICMNLTKDKSEENKELSKYLELAALKTKPSEINRIPRNASIHLMLTGLEEAYNVEKERNLELIQHLQEVVITNQNMITEREALIAQNIADVRKLQEDTICWKERYEECAAKLEMMDKKQDPRLIEAQDTIATLKRTIAILQQEKTVHPKLYDVSTSTASPRKFLSSSDSDGGDKSSSDLAVGALQTELSACRKLLETYAVEKNENKKNNESIKVIDLEQKLQIEVSKREILEHQVKRLLSEVQQRIDTGHLNSIQQKLEKEFVSRKELEEIKNLHGEALEKVRQEVISQSESKLSAKLAEINSLIHGQMQEQLKLEKMRENSECSIKLQFQNISCTLQTELGKMQTALKAKEDEERLFRHKFEEMEQELKKSLKAKQKSVSDLSNHSENTSEKGSTPVIAPLSEKKEDTKKLFQPQKEENNMTKKTKEKKVMEAMQQESLEEKFTEELIAKYIKKL